MTGERLRPQHLEHRRVVVKVGSNVLTAGTDRLDPRAMASIAEQIAELRRLGGQAVLVSSGAVAAGRHRVSTAAADGAARARDLHMRQVLAAIGQSRLMALWDELFDQHTIVIAQALLTRADLANRLAYLNARNTLMELLELGVVPIINENDVVSVEEIAATIGDNDNLSAQVANLIDADLLLILTDIAGLYTADPAHDRDAKLIERVERIDAEIEQAAAGGPGARGTGGMVTKVQAARIATQSGTHVVLAHGAADDVVLRAAAGEPAVGTHFLPTGDRMESRLRYLLSGLQTRGRIEIDAGAARALLRGANSLLPAGVVARSGEFKRGDVVQIVTGDGVAVARGIANYSSDEVDRIRGQHSDQIAGVLGYEYGEEVVHRNNMVLVDR